MRTVLSAIPVVLVMLTATQSRAQETGTKSEGPVPVDSVDLHKYVGTWYEIAKIPNSFQSKCAMNTTATYRLRNDGEIDVINRCQGSDGSENVAKGTAKVVDPKTDAKLKVSFVSIFGIRLFWGDYWIIGLDKDYRYVVVGTPSRKFGWILSRTPQLSREDKEAIGKILVRQGYNPADFVPTEQNGDKMPDSGPVGAK